MSEAGAHAERGLAAARTQGRAADVVIAGGGIAGFEALLALRHLAGELCDVTIVSPRQELVIKPWMVEEPFTLAPAQTHDLAGAAQEQGCRFVGEGINRVRPAEHRVDLAGGRELAYDALVMCVGARPRPALTRATTLWVDDERLDLGAALGRGDGGPGRVAYVIPGGPTWPLPAYELALMTRRWAEHHRSDELGVTLVTQESRPLEIFGTRASDAVAELLAARRIELLRGTSVVEEGTDSLRCVPSMATLDADPVLALPRLEGPAMIGLPADEQGFLSVDGHLRVIGEDDVYAAGDATAYPIKQGGIATQQADALAEHIAWAMGAPVDPAAVRPVLRGKLLTGEETLSLSRELGSDDPQGVASLDWLWWPPHKVAGHYLSAWLEGREPAATDEPPRMPIDVEAQLPHEWHAEPMGIDSERP